MSVPPAPATIIDVARVAGVSRQTVSRALNDMADVRATTKARVIAAARELNYRPNRAAQSMVRGRRTIIGLVLEDLSNPYFAELAAAVNRVAADRDWGVLLCDVGTDRGKARGQLATIVSGVDALVLTGCRTDTLSLLPEDVLRGGQRRLPLVMIDGPADERLNGRVVLEVEQGVRAAVDRLVAQGRRRIAFLGSEVGTDVRRDVFRAGLEEHDLSWRDLPALVAEESMEGGMRGAGELLEQCPELDAVLVYNDIMALGVLKTLARAGRRVPEEVAVIGVDGLDIGRLVTPELTTLAIDKARLAEAAVTLLERAFSDGGTGPVGESVVGLTLLLRDSA
ncbi:MULTISPECIES: LacI family DNA-binding transcriptional regulator [unclassified Rathayibacter]|uniref:LacI family DNA-binding transcriptional regulator n=1 Tax=unclassified Rathayibacter TaxID=2609250 RepID=UPI000F4BE5F0|nr:MULTISPECIES: LacI family DNA-binding transcriptional regulator [unclassified Rathayibacter]MCJ1673721.1 LacI family transcriptional regulator [Rathayibacter sp. VKM Ac-2929]MCJ1705801.1 LacI family transcriptional regulator [Rathayibacter sp. VKM Ac-2926]ROP49773.1 LacI family transcriptional regulator [Rathayibacter sp. PhB186]ROS51733.1 LacI family transcriptional regulator [Rathayibacter sp. PhB185]TCL86074.1 LacI family transcriptional regulator [Rathayibacter sp. PhB192]